MRISDWSSDVCSSDLSLDSRFFWLVVLTTTFGVILSFTRARRLEGVGASSVGSVFLYILIATIGMQMDLKTLVDRPMLLLLGVIWIRVHAALMRSEESRGGKGCVSTCISRGWPYT